MRTGTKFGDVGMVDTMMKDGLIDAFNNYHMGITGVVVYSEWMSDASAFDPYD